MKFFVSFNLDLYEKELSIDVAVQVHNLKNIEVHSPQKKLVVITGLAGVVVITAFDTIYAKDKEIY